MKTKIRGICAVIALSVVLLAIIASVSADQKTAVRRTVLRQQTFLLQQIESGERLDAQKLRGVREVRYYHPHRLIEFRCGGFGLGSATSYYGFYYSPDGHSDALWCAGKPLLPSGDGWLYEEKGGDNRYYTEAITDDFYYYEASF